MAVQVQAEATEVTALAERRRGMEVAVLAPLERIGGRYRALLALLFLVFA